MPIFHTAEIFHRYIRHLPYNGKQIYFLKRLYMNVFIFLALAKSHLWIIDRNAKKKSLFFRLKMFFVTLFKWIHEKCILFIPLKLLDFETLFWKCEIKLYYISFICVSLVSMKFILFEKCLVCFLIRFMIFSWKMH